MNREQTGPAEYVVYVRHESTSAASGYQSTTAAPTSLSSIMRNRTVVLTTPAAQVGPSGIPARDTE